MKRAIIKSYKNIEIADVAELIPAKIQVKVKVAYCGICGSDMEEFTSKDNFSDCFGHEISGIVSEIGSDVTRFKVGDKVAVHSYSALGFSEYTVESEDKCVKLANDADLKEAALLEPLAVALCGIRYCDFRIGDTVYVSGCGTIGLLAIQCLKAFGARKIIAANRNEFRRNKAKEFGADFILDPSDKSTENIVDFVEEKIGEKVDFSLECAGADASILACNKVLKAGKTLCALGLSSNSMSLSAFQLFVRPGTWEPGVKIQGMTPFDINMFEVGARMIESKVINPLQIVTKVFSFSEIANAFDFALNNKNEQIKILIQMEE